MSDDLMLCAICKKSPATEKPRRPWVILNRYGYGTSDTRGFTESRNNDGEYFWEVGDDIDAEREIVTGPLLCFPACLQTFLEGKMLEADIAMGHTE